MGHLSLQANADCVQLLFALRYDGALLHGTALQPDVPTAAGLVVARVHRHLAPTRLWALSVTARLDAGVHAHVNLLSLRIEAPHLAHRGLAAALAALEADASDALCGLVVTVMPQRVSARGMATSKIYRYVVEDDRAHLDTLAQDTGIGVWRIAPKLDVARMQAAADVFVGKHDFTAFAASPKRRKQSVAQAIKCVTHMRVHPPQTTIQGARTLYIDCEAHGLLRRQMRFMVASIVCAGAQLTCAQAVRARLEAAHPPAERAPQAPAWGLYLMHLVCPAPMDTVVADLVAALDAQGKQMPRCLGVRQSALCAIKTP